MFDAMLAELRRQKRLAQARGSCAFGRAAKFSASGRERAGPWTPRQSTRNRRASSNSSAPCGVSPLISVAEVQGDAFGFGFGLAIVCDFVYAIAESAALGFPEMKFGLAPAAIMAYLGEYALPRFAFPLVLFGDPIAPPQAQQIGLISHVRSSEPPWHPTSMPSSSAFCGSIPTRRGTVRGIFPDGAAELVRTELPFGHGSLDSGQPGRAFEAEVSRPCP